MSDRLTRSVLLAISSVIIFLLMLASALAAAPGTNCSTASAEDVAAGFKPGTTVCDNDREVMGESGKAKEELEKMWCGGKAGECKNKSGTYTSTMTGLDAKFSICVDKLFKEAGVKPSGGKTFGCISQAFRSYKQQECMCGTGMGVNGCLGADNPRELHDKGLAVDIVSTKEGYTKLRQAAAKIGLKFPPGLGNIDGGHVEVDATDKCRMNPKTSQVRDGNGAPSAGVTESLRDLFGNSPKNVAETPISGLLPQSQELAGLFDFPESADVSKSGTTYDPEARLREIAESHQRERDAEAIRLAEGRYDPAALAALEKQSGSTFQEKSDTFATQDTFGAPRNTQSGTEHPNRWDYFYASFIPMGIHGIRVQYAI